MLTAGHPVRFDAGPVAQHHLVGGGGYVRTGRKGLDQEIGRVSRQHRALLAPNSDDGLNAHRIEDR